MSEIFVRLPQELQMLVEYYRGGKYINGIWKCPLDKELVDNFEKIYKPRQCTHDQVGVPPIIIILLNDISNKEEITTKFTTLFNNNNHVINKINYIHNKKILIYPYSERGLYRSCTSVNINYDFIDYKGNVIRSTWYHFMR